MRGSVAPAVPRVLSPRTGYVRSLDWIEWQNIAGRGQYRVDILEDESFDTSSLADQRCGPDFTLA